MRIFLSLREALLKNDLKPRKNAEQREKKLKFSVVSRRFVVPVKILHDFSSACAKSLRETKTLALAVFLLLVFAFDAAAQQPRTGFQKKTAIKNSARKAQRRSIRFPADCTTDRPAGSKNWTLQENCAEALTAVLPALPREDCDYEPYRKNFDDFLVFATSAYPDAVRFYPLATNKYLVEIVCSTAAYNTSKAYLLYDESKLPATARVLEFPSLEFTYDEESDRAETVESVKLKTVGARRFDLRTKQLIVFDKARGIGDAGRYARYSFPNGEPRLLELRAKFSWTGRGYSTEEILRRPPLSWKRYYPK